ncbi:LysR family transcriptional regulator ArgP [Aquabacterium sp. OR-4]|uniref:LysR family transcriptional regulator ArgP n=1 Tax=Aquabacterium sp. OR-4 TaxID=2978127 RepID=UPI0028C9176A|nr:LysR family transcriptional regulator ArgP [Aquabacterium sp. OR-4]MDT7838661.1 LysR family transcriptional regulator ArgP [Aquabacterium sp. OR-4]
MLDYAALSALAAVVREGSFERAAQVLHVTPSAVSQRIRALEERMGSALVVRAQPCRATEAGRRLCQHVDRVALMEQDLRGDLPTLAALTRDGRTRVPLPVAVNADSLASWFAPALAAYAADAPVLVQVAVDDQDHTAEWLRTGQVLAAVTSAARPPAGCNGQPLGAMRYRAAATPAFMARHFAAGVNAGALARAPSLVFDLKDELQARWVRRQCRRPIELPRHMLPSAQAFVVAALAGMGWGLHEEGLVAAHLRSGRLVELVPDTPLDVPLYWQHARAASGLLQQLTAAVLAGARQALRPTRPART